MDNGQRTTGQGVTRWWRRWATLLGGLCLLALVGVGYGVVRPQVEAWRNWRQAHSAAEEGDFDRAKDHLARCLEVWPRSGETHFLMARTLRRAGSLDDAARHLDEAERLGQAPAGVALERALLEAQFGNLELLGKVLAGRRAALPPEEEGLVREALVAAYLQAQLVDRAYQVAGKWVDDRPDDWQGHFWHGRVLEQGLQLDQAVAAYRRALELRPEAQRVHCHLAEVLLRRQRYAEAAPHFEHCLGKDPHDRGARVGLARCRRDLSGSKAALATLQPLLDEQPPDAGACLLRGQLAQDADQLEEALAWLRRAAALAPDDVATNYALAGALRRLKRPADAKVYERRRQEVERDYKRLEQIIREVAQKPRDVGLRREAGTILLRRGQAAEAARWLLSALRVDRQDQPTRQALLDCLPRLGDPRLTEHARRTLGP
jgi:tetratricopeptide (TPR) repeat protein